MLKICQGMMGMLWTTLENVEESRGDDVKCQEIPKDIEIFCWSSDKG